jgi:hypothetical protein
MLVPLGTHQRTDSIASSPLVSAGLVQQFTCPRKSHKRCFLSPVKLRKTVGEEGFEPYHRLMKAMAFQFVCSCRWARAGELLNETASLLPFHSSGGGASLARVPEALCLRTGLEPASQDPKPCAQPLS